MKKFKLSIFWLVCLVICIVVAVIYGWIDYRFKDVQVSGVIKNLEDGQLLLYGEHDGKVDTIQLDKEGSFVCHFSEKEIPGVYVLCIPQTSTTVFLYLRAGARVRVSYDALQSDLTPVITGNVTVESEIIRKINEEFLEMELEQVAQKTFSEYSGEIYDRYDGVVKLLDKVKDRKFVAMVLKELKARRDYCLYYYRVAYKLCISLESDVQEEAFWEFVRNLDLNNIENAKSDLLSLVIAWDMQTAKIERSAINCLCELKRRVSNQEVLNYMSEQYMVSALCNETSSDELTMVYDFFVQLCDDCDILCKVEKEYEAVKRALTRFAPGKEMIDLEMFDRDGNSVHLADVKGDLVYVDIWASWCGSCCYEMAFLEKLVERYKDSLHLEVVSLSIDKNEKAWLARAQEDRPGWKQYQATELSQRILEEEYHITAIPRFMLLDRNGKIIDAHAPRPSDDIIHQLIHRFLTSRAMVQGNFSLVLDNTY